MRTPTTRAIRRVYALAPPNLAQCNHTNPNEGYAAEQFDRWYQEELRKAKADGFDEGIGASGLDLDYILQLLDNNPYRSKT